MNTLLSALFYFFIVVLVFGVFIFIHELGHFLTARMCKVSIKEFAIGLGPKLLSKTSAKSKIKYTLRALPIGGFVSMEGEDDASDDANAFCNKKLWQRMLIILAGPLMNLILGFILMSILICSQSTFLSTTVDFFGSKATSNEFLQPNDVIIAIDNTKIYTGSDLSYEIMFQGYEPISVTVERDGEKITFENVVFPTFEDSGALFGQRDFALKEEAKSFSTIIKHTYFRSLSTIKMVYDSLGGLVSGRFGMEAVSGPVGVTEVVGEAAKNGFSSFLYIITVLTINLGVFNLIPFPALDGGRLLFLIIEAIRRKPLNKNIEGYINFVGIIILFAFMILVTFKDIIKLFF